MAGDRLPVLRERLLKWYRRHRRDLPWRRSRDPYQVWVSEIMLQQTRVDVVVPYFLRFVERFPDPTSLAAADEQEVLAQWSGLGYYRRARMLHQAAAEVVREHAGSIPADREAVLSLPGVGRYTAGAILSIAHGMEEPILDGNVIRVLCRLLALEGRPDRQPLQAELWRRAAELVRGPDPGDLNQALMELGATVCTPSANPDCAACPWRTDCAAHAEGRVAELPQLAQRKPPKLETWTVMVGRRHGRFLLRRRVTEELMRDLWELPSAVCQPTPRRRAEQSLSALVAGEVRLGPELTRIERGISGRRISMHVHSAETSDLDGRHTRWLTHAQASEKPLTTPTRLLLRQLSATPKNPT